MKKAEIYPCYGLDGEQITFEEWGKLMKDDARLLGRTHLNGHFVSTVWIGVPHGHLQDGPLIFETMVFCEHAGGCDWQHDCYRYPTKKQALIGHAIICNEVTGERHDE